MSSPRVMVIALSEASFELMETWRAEGKLPNIQRLADTGVCGPLRSQLPFVTPQMWATILTGLSPGRHGIFDFWQRGPDGRFTEISGATMHGRPIWDLLSERGKRVGFVNVPLTYPPARVDGFMISGQDAPGAHRSIANPPELFDALVQRFGPYRFKEIFPGGRQKSDYLTLFEEDTDARTDALEYLVAEQDWDLFFCYSSATAMAQHYFWGDMASKDPDNPFQPLVFKTFACLDRMIGRMVAAAGDDTMVFLISECGAGPLKSGVEINTWLEQEGFLAYNTPPGEGAPLKMNRKAAIAGLRKTVQSVLPLPAQTWLNRNMTGLKAWVQAQASRSDIDWSRTQAFTYGKEGNVYINLKGRDPHGIVEPGAGYEEVQDRLSERLLALIDPASGRNAVDAVHRAQDYFDGPMLAWAPDLVIDWHNGEYMPNEASRRSDRVFVERWREYMNWPTTGSHRLNGIFYAAGPGIEKAKTLTNGRILDLAPTWLHALGIDRPAEMEGTVLSEIFNGSAASG